MSAERETIQATELQQTWLFPDEVLPANATPSRTRGRKRNNPSPAFGMNELRAELLTQIVALQRRLEAIEQQLRTMCDSAPLTRVEKEFYSTQEVARLLGKRPYTVREWCRLQRVHAEKTWSGRGQDDEWRISREELLRIQNEGLLPLDKPGRTRLPRPYPK